MAGLAELKQQCEKKREEDQEMLETIYSGAVPKPGIKNRRVLKGHFAKICVRAEMPLG